MCKGEKEGGKGGREGGREEREGRYHLCNLSDL